MVNQLISLSVTSFTSQHMNINDATSFCFSKEHSRNVDSLNKFIIEDNFPLEYIRYNAKPVENIPL